MKKYPFSMKRHGHDIELARNLLFSQYIYPDGTSAKLRAWAQDMRDRLGNILSAGVGCNPIVYLTGEEIGLARRAIEWATLFRAARMDMTPEEINAGK